MAVFFILTHDSAVGPFTGIELREACLAGIVRYSAVIGASDQGPWHRASEIGLFSDKKIPLPHPPGTPIPEFHVQGMSNSFPGPFKLRELIGFASRGMLPAGARLQSSPSAPWAPVLNFPVLAACLQGQLVQLDEAGKVHLQTEIAITKNSPQAPPDSPRVKTVAPIQVAQVANQTRQRPPAPVDAKEAAAAQAEIARHRDRQRELAAPSQPLREPEISKESLTPARSSMLHRVTETLARPFFPPRLVRLGGGLLVILAGVALATAYWPEQPMLRQQVLGDWGRYVPGDGGVDLKFAISFSEDGRLVMCHSPGSSKKESSWTGQFEWSDFRSGGHDATTTAAFSSVVDERSPSHTQGVLDPSDGHVRLRGFVKESPTLDGHCVRDFFVRREGPDLMVGYPVAIHWASGKETAGSSQTEVGWIRMHPLNNPMGHRETIRQSDLQQLGKEESSDSFSDSFSDERGIPSLSEAITRVTEGVTKRFGNQERRLHQSRTQSQKLTLAWLLQQYGMPDEARPLYRFEIVSADNLEAARLKDAEMIRYGQWKFIFSANGDLRYLATHTNP